VKKAMDVNVNFFILDSPFLNIFLKFMTYVIFLVKLINVKYNQFASLIDLLYL